MQISQAWLLIVVMAEGGKEIPGSVAFLFSDDDSYITGEILSIDGGANIQNTNRNAGGAGLGGEHH